MELLKSKKLTFSVVDSSPSGIVIDIDVWAKPGSKVDKIFVSPEGHLTISTRSKPVEGEANAAIVMSVAEIFGISKSNVSLLRGEKSRQKKLRVLLQFTPTKNKTYFLHKLQDF